MKAKSRTVKVTVESHDLRCRIEGPLCIDAGRNRFLHGPCVTRCSNGDWICAYQDSLDDPGRESIIRQRRSTDNAKTWVDEGIIYNEIDEGFGSRNPAFGQTDEGQIFMVIQRVGLRRLGEVRGENIMGSKLLVSHDCGKTYENRGIIDKTIRRGHQGCSTHILNHDGRMYMPAFHPDGLVIYISENSCGTWPHRIVLAQESQLPERPYYPTITARPGGSLLFLAHLNHAQRCISRTSDDGGFSWSEIRFPEDIRLRHPVLGYVGDTMICAGRNMEIWKPALCISPDHGESWSEPIDLVPDLDSGGGYTALWPTEDPNRIFIAFSAAGSTMDAQDILGVFIKSVMTV